MVSVSFWKCSTTWKEQTIWWIHRNRNSSICLLLICPLLRTFTIISLMCLSRCAVFTLNRMISPGMRSVSYTHLTRAGCLVCPNSSGKHEYIKRMSYTEEVDAFLNKIASTSGKTNYTHSEMQAFIDAGYWRTRKSGRELNFGQDKFEVRTRCV